MGCVPIYSKQEAFVAILPLMSAHVPSLIWEIQANSEGGLSCFFYKDGAISELNGI